MTQADLIVNMLDAAAPVVKSYWTDLRHDARMLADAEPGDVFLWAPRKCGTHIIVLWRGDKPNVTALSTFSAMQNLDKTLQWYRIIVGDTFEQVDSDLACTLSREAWHAAESGKARVSELHL